MVSAEEDAGRLPAWAWRAALVGVGVLWAADAVAGVLAALRPLLVMLLVSFLVACTLEPPVNALVRRGVRRGLGAFVLLGAVVVGVLGAVLGAGTVLVAQYDAVVVNAPDLAGRAAVTLNGVAGTSLDPAVVSERAREVLERGELTGLLGAAAGGLGASAARGVGLTLASLLVVFYLVADGPRARRAVCSVLPPQRQRTVLQGWELAIDKAGGWLLGRAVLAVITATVSAGAFVVLGVDYPLLLALWVGLATHLIPIVGAWLGGALAVTVALAERPGLALAVIVFLVVFAYVRNFFIAPRVVRVTLRIHPAVGFVAVIAGGLLFGPAVALVALPTVATVQAFAGAHLRRHDVVTSPLTDTHPPAATVGP